MRFALDVPSIGGRVLAATVFTSVIAAQTPPPARVDDGRQWVDAKPTITADSPAILRGAIAAAFNDAATAEPLLQKIIRSQPKSEDAHEAHLLLSRIYLRSGQYKRLYENLEAWAASFPGRTEVRTDQKDMELFRGLPDQVNGPRQPMTLPHDKGEGEFSAPVSINGKSAEYLFDSGAWISTITEAEAVRLGLEIRKGAGVVGDSSGKNVTVRTTVAKEVRVGPMRFQNVSFIVLPSQDSGGILGIPVLLALSRLQWSNDGTWQLAGPAGTNEREAANLVFFENRLLLAMRVSNTRVFGVLDTGAVDTDLNSNLADQLKELIQSKGTRGSRDITGVGGTATVDSIALPELTFDIFGTPATLRPAHVTLQRTSGMGGKCCIGNIGRDLLLQTGRLVIDFSTMTLKIK
jgi:predicted aspartyl protease